jgi:hypothetical protein
MNKQVARKLRSYDYFTVINPALVGTPFTVTNTG